MRERAKALAVPPDVLDRAVPTARQLLTQIEEADLVRSNVGASMESDETALHLTLTYRGTPLILPHTGVHRVWLEELVFSYSLADVLRGVHPDRLTSHVHGEHVAICATFDL